MPKKKIFRLQGSLRVVIDTDLFVSGIISKKGTPFNLLETWRKGEFVLVSSLKIIEEIVKVLNYPKIKKAKSIREKDIKELVATILKFSVIVPGKLKVKVIEEDPEDNKFLEAVLEGQANYILSGDKHLLSLREFRGIRILTAKEFLNQILKQRWLI